MYQYYRVAAAVPDMRVADTAYNVDQMLQKVEEAKQKGVNLITFPELSVTGYIPAADSAYRKQKRSCPFCADNCRL